MKSTPTVGYLNHQNGTLISSWKLLLVNLLIIEDFPTDLSPSKTIFNLRQFELKSPDCREDIK